MVDDWLEQLRQLHEADRVSQETKFDKEQQKQEERQERQKQASEILRQSKAHELLRQVQKTLLAGQGLLDIFDRASDYDRVISLVWQGPISAARKPDPDDPAEYQYILVGVRQGKLWVNGKQIPAATPETLKTALLKASKKPGREKPG